METRHVTLLLLSILTLTLLPSCNGKRKEVIRIWFSGSYNRDFNDLNDLHLSSAKALGVVPVDSRENAKHASRKMKEIRSNDLYDIEELTHSIPFLVPEAEKLLEKISENFRDTLENHHAPRYKLLVTSVTRTTEDVTKLRKRNMNSSQNSAHLYGTTFDISWNLFPKVDVKDTVNLPAEDLKMALAIVLRDLQKAERCYVKHERKQGCFHITVRK